MRKENVRVAKKDAGSKEKPKRYKLRLYVTGQTPNSVRAIENLERILHEELRGLYDLRTFFIETGWKCPISLPI